MFLNQSKVKAMSQEVNIDLVSAFCEAACLNKDHYPWRQRKKDGASYGWFEVVSAECSSQYWYHRFDGVRFYGMIRWEPARWRPGSDRKVIREIQVIRTFKLVWINVGRTIPSKNIRLL